MGVLLSLTKNLGVFPVEYRFAVIWAHTPEAYEGAKRCFTVETRLLHSVKLSDLLMLKAVFCKHGKLSSQLMECQNLPLAPAVSTARVSGRLFREGCAVEVPLNDMGCWCGALWRLLGRSPNLYYRSSCHRKGGPFRLGRQAQL